MIVQEFYFPEDHLHYFAGLGSLINTNLELEGFFNLIDLIQNQFEDVILQFFNRKLILNFNHIFYAIYHTLKSFHLKTNISNKMGIEFLLYLGGNRQIKKAIESFGITTHQINQGTIDFCIISINNNLRMILTEILTRTKAKEISFDLGKKSYTEFEIIRKYFRINENQIKTVLKSYRVNAEDTFSKESNFENLYLALEDLICEKMVLLSLERNTYD